MDNSGGVPPTLGEAVDKDILVSFLRMEEEKIRMRNEKEKLKIG